MTHKDIYIKFMIEYDKANVTSSYPSLTEYEVATVLDKAYNAIIAQKVTGNNVRHAGFEMDVKAMEDLAPLVVHKQIDLTSASSTIAPNVYKGELPDNHLYFIDSYLKMKLPVKHYAFQAYYGTAASNAASGSGNNGSSTTTPTDDPNDPTNDPNDPTNVDNPTIPDTPVVTETVAGTGNNTTVEDINLAGFEETGTSKSILTFDGSILLNGTLYNDVIFKDPNHIDGETDHEYDLMVYIRRSTSECLYKCVAISTEQIPSDQMLGGTLYRYTGTSRFNNSYYSLDDIYNMINITNPTEFNDAINNVEMNSHFYIAARPIVGQGAEVLTFIKTNPEYVLALDPHLTLVHGDSINVNQIINSLRNNGYTVNASYISQYIVVLVPDYDISELSSDKLPYIIYYTGSGSKSSTTEEERYNLYPVTHPIDNQETRNVPVTLTTHQIAKRFFSTVYNLPWIKNPVCYIESDENAESYGKAHDSKDEIFVVVDPWDTPIVDGSSVLTVVYIKKPNSFVKNLPNATNANTYQSFFDPGEAGNDVKRTYIFELNDTVAEEVVSLAVTFALENVESPRLNSKLNMRGLEA